MMDRARHLPIAAALLAAGFCTPAAAVTQTAAVNANVVKPLTLTALQPLNLGTIMLPPGSWSGAVVGISKTGVFSCSTKVVCSGARQVAQFKVTGTNKMVVQISAPNVTLVNQANSSQTLNLAIDNPGTVTLTSSGEPGSNFNIGGSVTLNSATVGGLYKGTINVTVNYQ